VKGLWFDWLREYRPDLIGRYERLYPRGAYMSSADRNKTTEFARRHRRTKSGQTRPVLGRSYAPHRNDPAPPEAFDADECAPARAPEQVSLF
jgi:hypothetical protein